MDPARATTPIMPAQTTLEQHSEKTSSVHAFTTQTSLPDVATELPPDGGLVAWLQVLAGHLVVFNTFGYIISFGIFQSHYETVLSISPSAVSWIGSIQICLVYFVGVFSGRAFDAGYYKLVLLIGCLLQLIGIFMTSIASQYWQLLLAQGLCQGIGCGLAFAPMVANLSTYFTRKRSLALSSAACGGATGGMVFPLIAQQLLPKIEFAWTIRVMGLVVLITSVIIMCLVRPRLPSRKTGPLVDMTAFKEPTYVLFVLSMFFTMWATYFAYFYTRVYAVARLGGSQSTSFTMLLVINAVGIPGRLVPAYLADRYLGAINTFIPVIIGAAICQFAWIAVDNIGGDFAWVAIYGIFGAAIQGMFPATSAALSKDPTKSGTRIGMIFTIVSIACLTGPPIAGRLIEAGGGSFLAAQIWGGSCLILGCTLLVAASWANSSKHRCNDEPMKEREARL